MDPLPPHVSDLVASGQKIEAIKEVRAHTGLGLREAKEIVERLERGATLPSGTSPHASRVSPPLDAQGPEDLAARVLALVKAGHTIQAIKEVRDGTGVGLREAKHVVDRVAEGVEGTPDLTGPDRPPPPRAAAVVMLVAALVVGLAIVLFLLA